MFLHSQHNDSPAFARLEALNLSTAIAAGFGAPGMLHDLDYPKRYRQEIRNRRDAFHAALEACDSTPNLRHNAFVEGVRAAYSFAIIEQEAPHA